MIAGGVTELIWHFVAHLHITEDIARDRIAYDDAALRKGLDDYTTKRPDFDSNPDLDELDTHPLPPPSIELRDEHFGSKAHFQKPLPDTPSEDDLGLPRRLAAPPVLSPAGGGGGGASHEIKVVYEPGGEQSEIQIRQLNAMQDNDVSISGSVQSFDMALINAQAAQLSVHAASMLQQMADEANEQIPTNWWISQNGEGIKAFVQEFDKDQAEHGGMSNPNSIAPGYYLNGELQTPAPDAPDPVLGKTVDHDTGHDLGVWAEAGGNVSFNAALIVDMSESGRSMIVMGDYFHTNAIFQTNSIQDHDTVTTSGSDLSSVLTGQNTSDNIADFIQHPGVYASMSATYAGPNWHVDVVHGDYYNIQTVVQMNYLFDNDTIVQNSGSNHYDLVAGENEQGNLTQLFNGDIHYDLIVVAGAYHGMNVIFQNNILLNNDNITLLTSGEDPSQSVSSGQNEMLNAATIENYGNDHFLSLNDDLSNLVASIGSGATHLDPETGTLLPGTGGTFNVLYITGDYYDVNAVWQTNVVSDVNVLIQYLDAASQAAQDLHPGDEGAQNVTTGKDKLTNDAIIVDVGPTDAYVGGQVYGDTILVQANLVPTDGDHALTKDANSLVTELIAFVGNTETEEQPAHPVTLQQPHDDAIACVMH